MGYGVRGCSARRVFVFALGACHLQRVLFTDKEGVQKISSTYGW